ncbi:MAG: glutathione S-transferase family protein [Alphaproteobacteria bacterium]|nr:MAG: glutathione S-transferase family protein [Alphaproteobacteria bacterium]
MKLIVGNKNYSSWSLRPWIGLKAARIPFEEEVISLYVEGGREQILRHSPAGKVPILIDGDVRVWESLAILEYAAERFPGAGLWPSDPAARAHARAISAEMHAGFAALREECTMNFWRPPARRALSAAAQANAVRVQEIWVNARASYGAGGPFLFGTFTAADAMYAPVVQRFIAYDIEVSAAAKAYMQAMTALPAWQEWRRAALSETWVIAKFEYDWPEVKRLPAEAV